MKVYFVEVKSYLPYPIEKKYWVKASGMRTAVGRGIINYRKEVNRKKIRELTIKVKDLQQTSLTNLQDS